MTDSSRGLPPQQRSGSPRGPAPDTTRTVTPPVELARDTIPLLPIPADTLAPSTPTDSLGCIRWVHGPHAGQRACFVADSTHRDHVTRHGVGTLQGANTMSPTPGVQRTDCVKWVLSSVAEVYRAEGRTARWAEILRIVRADGLRGTTLARELQRDGWNAHYFSPGADTLPASVQGEQRLARSMWQRARRGEAVSYWNIRIDGLHADSPAATGPGSAWADLAQREFYVGVFDSGQHCFVGSHGSCSEAHWLADATNPDVITNHPLTNKFSDWDGALVMTPPGEWGRRQAR